MTDAFPQTFSATKKLLETDFNATVEDLHLNSVAPDDQVEIHLYSGAHTKIRCGTLVDMTNSAKLGRTDKDGVFRHGGDTIARCVAENDTARRFCETLSMAGLHGRYLLSEDADRRIWVQNGITELSLLYSRDKIASDYYPEFGSDWLFVRVTSNTVADEIPQILAYFFSIEEALGLVFRAEPFSHRGLDDIFSFDEDDLEELERPRIRPLLPSELAEVLSLYLEACAIPAASFRVLAFIKVLEYASATAFRQEVQLEVRARLLQSAALTPDAEYIGGLFDLIAGIQKKRSSDADALKHALESFCSPLELVRAAPPFLKELRKLTASSSRQQVAEAMSKLSGAVSATRNEIAHAKANYAKTGNECPTEQMESFSELIKLVARQAIHWLSTVESRFRVTSPWRTA